MTSSDGKRFLMIKEAASQSRRTQIVVIVQNWLNELKRPCRQVVEATCSPASKMADR